MCNTFLRKKPTRNKKNFFSNYDSYYKLQFDRLLVSLTSHKSRSAQNDVSFLFIKILCKTKLKLGKNEYDWSPCVADSWIVQSEPIATVNTSLQSSVVWWFRGFDFFWIILLSVTPRSSYVHPFNFKNPSEKHLTIHGTKLLTWQLREKARY